MYWLPAVLGPTTCKASQETGTRHYQTTSSHLTDVWLNCITISAFLQNDRGQLQSMGLCVAAEFKQLEFKLACTRLLLDLAMCFDKIVTWELLLESSCSRLKVPCLIKYTPVLPWSVRSPEVIPPIRGLPYETQ